MVDALLKHLPVEPDLRRVQMIAAACLGHQEPLAVSLTEIQHPSHYPQKVFPARACQLTIMISEGSLHLR